MESENLNRGLGLSDVVTRPIDDYSATATPVARVVPPKAFDEVDSFATQLKKLKATPPPISVSWESLSYTVPLAATPERIDDVFNYLPSRLGLLRRPTVPAKVIHDITGYAAPGHMVMVIGAPRSGKTTLLRSIAAQHPHIRGSSQEGTIKYDGVELHADKVKRLLVYAGLQDLHYPYLTVRETVDFAINCFKADFPGGEPPPEMERFVDNRAKADLVLGLMGLTKVADSPVGSTEVRGISKGEAHLLTLAEMSCAGLSVLLLDEPTKEMDFKGSLDFLKRMQTFAQELNFTCVSSFNMASQEVYDLFDEVTVLAGGRMAYFGPTHKAEAYFASLGYVRPANMSLPDYLQEVVLDDGSKFFQGGQERAQRSPDEFAKAFKESTAYTQLTEDIAKLNKGKSPEGPPVPSGMLSWPQQFTACFKRQMIVHARAYENWLVRSLVIIFLGFLAGTLFWRIPHMFTGVLDRAGLIFFVLTIVSGTSWSKTPELFLQRPVLYKQTAAGMYHPAPYLAAITAADSLIRAPGSFIFTCLFYWLAGFSAKDHSGKFWYAVLLVYWMEMCSDALVRLISLFCKTVELGQFFSGTVLVYVAFSAGFLVIKDDIVNPWKWMYWINPGRYYFDGFVGSEFSKTDWCRDDNPFFCQVAANPAEHTTSGAVAADQVDVHDIRNGIRWLDLGIVWAFWWLYLAVGCVVITYLRWDYLRPTNASTLDLRSDAAPKTSVTRASMDPSADPKLFHSFKRMFLSFTDIGYVVPVTSRLPFTNSTKPKRLLSSVTGYAVPGTVTAVLGPSGCGKTTFLDVLAGQKTVGTCKGQVRVNGADLGAYVRRCMAYAEQSLESQAPLQTVGEAIRTSAELRLPSDVPADVRRDIVLRTIQLMGLAPYAGDLVGTLENGLPLDVRRRLVIAVEVVTCHPILLLDAPLAGLDPRGAEEVLEALRQVAASGRTVLLTLENPSPATLADIDNIIVLNGKGRQVYFGPPAGVAAVITPARDIPEGATPMELLSLVREELAEERPIDLLWQESDMRKALVEGIEGGKFQPDGLVPPVYKSAYVASYFTQCRVLLGRHFTMFYRNPWCVHGGAVVTLGCYGEFVGSFSDHAGRSQLMVVWP
eukprot:jgi/Mesvir1/3314/Mv08150-RA.2